MKHGVRASCLNSDHAKFDLFIIPPERVHDKNSMLPQEHPLMITAQQQDPNPTTHANVPINPRLHDVPAPEIRGLVRSVTGK